MRPATDAEIHDLAEAAGGEVWGYVVERDQTVVGRCAVKLSGLEPFVFGMNVDSADAFDALRLWRFVRRDLRARGYRNVYMHLTCRESERVWRMWMRRSEFVPVAVILEGSV